VKALNRSILLSSSASSTDHMVIFPSNTPLPAHYELPVQLPNGSLAGSFVVSLGRQAESDPVVPAGEVNFTLSEVLKDGEDLKIVFSVTENNTDGLKVEVLKGTESVTKLDISIC
jgi:hypothetical protein